MNRITVKVICSNSNHWTTGINATLEEARAYFIGQVFTREDQVTGAEIHDIPVSVELVQEPPATGAA